MPVLRKRESDASARSRTRAGDENAGLPSAISRAFRIGFGDSNRRVCRREPSPLTGAPHARVRLVVTRYRTRRRFVRAVAERKHLLPPRR